ncbi:heme-dependent oxidative N-demethylase family protein [Thiohalophilus sp.]|uniref:heme-dependent oxidative N-demethylase family protein n=1 Tax=Thiohalophilus sp. TaxID=3028392 RepID=UPI00397640DC
MATPDEPVAHYFPLSSGQYAIKPGFYRLGHDFGNGATDRRLFQLDRQFADYRQVKQDARCEQLDKYFCVTPEAADLAPILNRFLIDRLCSDFPGYFHLFQTREEQQLDCGLSGQSLQFTRDGHYLGASPANPANTPPYCNGLDALALQVQEDLALLDLRGEQARLCAIHLCQPNHWDPREKIGRDFAKIHQPVPDMHRINARAAQLLQACLQEGPFVRFAWGIATDERLNHHPDPPPGTDRQQWQGRAFDPVHPAAWLRVERQVLHGLPQTSALLFTIRTYHTPLTRLSVNEQQLLYQAIAGMEPHHREYKGLADPTALLNWLGSLYTSG